GDLPKMHRSEFMSDWGQAPCISVGRLSSIVHTASAQDNVLRIQSKQPVVRCFRHSWLPADEWQKCEEASAGRLQPLRQSGLGSHEGWQGQGGLAAEQF